MSWLSSLLDKAGPVGKGLNTVVGGALSAADPFIQEIPVVGTIDRLGHKLGNYIPGGSMVDKIGAPGAGGGNGADSLLGLATIANSAYMQDKANNYAKLAGENADRAYAEKAPIRTAGLAGLQAPPRTLPTLGKIRTAGNPFAS